MKTFSSDGVTLAYLDQGAERPDAEPVLLIHGFASNAYVNWVDTGWVADLSGAGYRVIALDNRGHGRSEKLYDVEDYGAPEMAEDARRLLDHLAIPRAHVIGYSMGARLAAFLALAHPDRVQSLVFGGLGINMVRGMAGTGPIAHALEAPSVDDVKNQAARSFRVFAEQTKSDLKALAACIRSARAPISAEDVATLVPPVLVAVGEHDVVGGSATELADVIPGAEAFVIEGREHMRATGDRTFKAAVRAFLARHPLT
ncbi:alpha/beta fold hydrolase [Hyphomicrobium sp.]|uniref:alpha/beta fold hydrolase n=1 Tax=Hyphomicrobium sp. TaxID=82 RepID=UPI0025BC5D6A|nr:alpha/beta fold hydrolase [Hyphomicrobium sp.]MCC7251011.1 alpha/beta fold hydrolase [Hyphomicrobium sp.]